MKGRTFELGVNRSGRLRLWETFRFWSSIDLSKIISRPSRLAALHLYQQMHVFKRSPTSVQSPETWPNLNLKATEEIFASSALPQAQFLPSFALSRFQNPIANGQHLDSTKKDIQTMKRRSHVLHKLLQGFVQRKDQRLLQHMLPPKSVYVISVRLSPLQRRLYQRLLDAIPSKQGKHGKNYLFQAYQSLTKVRVRKVSFCLGSKGVSSDRRKEMGLLSGFCDLICGF